MSFAPDPAEPAPMNAIQMLPTPPVSMPSNADRIAAIYDVIPATQQTQMPPPQSSSKTQNASTRFLWPGTSTSVFVGILVDMTRAGKRPGNGWKRIAWNSMVEQFNFDTGHNIVVDTLKNKERKIKTSFTAFKKLLENSSGWAIQYDKDHHQILCDDAVWEDYVKHHPEAVGLRDNPFPFYRELEEVYSTAAATGRHAQNAQNGSQAASADSAAEDLSQATERTPLSELGINSSPGNSIAPTLQLSATSSSSICGSDRNESPTRRSNAVQMNESIPSQKRGSPFQSAKEPGENKQKGKFDKKRNHLALSLDNAVQQMIMLQTPIVVAVPKIRDLIKLKQWKPESFITLTRFINQHGRAIVFNTMETDSEQVAYLHEEWIAAHPAAGLEVFDTIATNNGGEEIQEQSAEGDLDTCSTNSSEP